MVDKVRGTLNATEINSLFPLTFLCSSIAHLILLTLQEHAFYHCDATTVHGASWCACVGKMFAVATNVSVVLTLLLRLRVLRKHPFRSEHRHCTERIRDHCSFQQSIDLNRTMLQTDATMQKTTIFRSDAYRVK